jgi:hypothetical protein
MILSLSLSGVMQHIHETLYNFKDLSACYVQNWQIPSLGNKNKIHHHLFSLFACPLKF